MPPGEGQPGGAERLHAGGGRPGGLEGGEQVPQRALDGGVGVEDDVPGGVVDQPDRQRGDQLAAAGLGDDPAAQPGPDEMEFGLREGALKAQEESVVEVPRVVEAVFVADQGAGQAAQLEQLVPVGGVAGQPGAFQAEHDPGPAQRHLGDQLLEAFPVRGAGAGLALVDVDHGDLAGVPAERDRLAAQVVLADRGLGVVDDLLEAGLADVQKRRPGQVGGGHLRRRGIGEHRALLQHERLRGRAGDGSGERDGRQDADQLGGHRGRERGGVGGAGAGRLAAGAAVPGPAGARLARACRQAVTPLPVSTPNPSGNASARACRAA